MNPNLNADGNKMFGDEDLAWMEDKLPNMFPAGREKFEKFVFAVTETTPEVPLQRVVRWLLKENNCSHPQTKVCYRENYAGGILVCWKEFCNVCGKMIGSGIGLYDKQVKGRTVTIDPATKYDEGYVMDTDFLKQTLNTKTV